MFDDGKLAKALAAEEKNGLILSFDGEQMILIGKEWMACIPQHLLREKYRQTLGHLVEALGYVPETEICEIIKAKGEYFVNHPLPEVVGEHVGHYLGAEEDEAKFTGLTRNGRALYQIRAGAIFGCTMRGPYLRECREIFLPALCLLHIYRTRITLRASPALPRRSKKQFSFIWQVTNTNSASSCADHTADILSANTVRVFSASVLFIRTKKALMGWRRRTAGWRRKTGSCGRGSPLSPPRRTAPPEGAPGRRGRRPLQGERT